MALRITSHGIGVHKYIISGITYKGMFSEDKKWGPGVLRRGNQIIMEESHNRIDTSCRIIEIEAGGVRYEGETKNDRKHGFGCIYDPDGDII